MLRTVLVDDRPVNLDFLKKELEPYNYIEICDTYTYWEDALEGIERVKPDLLFLDIDMPGMNGLIMADAVKHICNKVVFVTDYLHYATDVYNLDVNVIFFAERNRLHEFLPRIMSKVLSFSETEVHFLAAYKPHEYLRIRPFCKENKTERITVFVRWEDIICIMIKKKSNGNNVNIYVETHDEGRSIIIYEEIRQLKYYQDLLNEVGEEYSNIFWHIHESTLVNQTYAKGRKNVMALSYSIVLRDERLDKAGIPLWILSRNRKKIFDNRELSYKF